MMAWLHWNTLDLYWILSNLDHKVENREKMALQMDYNKQLRTSITKLELIGI